MRTLLFLIIATAFILNAAQFEIEFTDHDGDRLYNGDTVTVLTGQTSYIDVAFDSPQTDVYGGNIKFESTENDVFNTLSYSEYGDASMLYGYESGSQNKIWKFLFTKDSPMSYGDIARINNNGDNFKVDIVATLTQDDPPSEKSESYTIYLETEDYIVGDYDGDGDVDQNDIDAALQWIFNNPNPGTNDYTNAIIRTFSINSYPSLPNLVLMERYTANPNDPTVVQYGVGRYKDADGGMIKPKDVDFTENQNGINFSILENMQGYSITYGDSRHISFIMDGDDVRIKDFSNELIIKNQAITIKGLDNVKSVQASLPTKSTSVSESIYPDFEVIQKNNEISITVPQKTQTGVQIFNNVGQIIETYKVDYGSINWNTSQVSPGAYFIKIENKVKPIIVH